MDEVELAVDTVLAAMRERLLAGCAREVVRSEGVEVLASTCGCEVVTDVAVVLVVCVPNWRAPPVAGCVPNWRALLVRVEVVDVGRDDEEVVDGMSLSGPIGKGERES